MNHRSSWYHPEIFIFKKLFILAHRQRFHDENWLITKNVPETDLNIFVNNQFESRF